MLQAPCLNRFPSKKINWWGQKRTGGDQICSKKKKTSNGIHEQQWTSSQIKSISTLETSTARHLEISGRPLKTLSKNIECLQKKHLESFPAQTPTRKLHRVSFKASSIVCEALWASKPQRKDHPRFPSSKVGRMGQPGSLGFLLQMFFFEAKKTNQQVWPSFSSRFREKKQPPAAPSCRLPPAQKVDNKADESRHGPIISNDVKWLTARGYMKDLTDLKETIYKLQQRNSGVNNHVCSSFVWGLLGSSNIPTSNLLYLRTSTPPSNPTPQLRWTSLSSQQPPESNFSRLELFGILNLLVVCRLNLVEQLISGLFLDALRASMMIYTDQFVLEWSSGRLGGAFKTLSLVQSKHHLSIVCDVSLSQKKKNTKTTSQDTPQNPTTVPFTNNSSSWTDQTDHCLASSKGSSWLRESMKAASFRRAFGWTPREHPKHLLERLPRVGDVLQKATHSVFTHSHLSWPPQKTWAEKNGIARGALLRGPSVVLSPSLQLTLLQNKVSLRAA